MEAREGIATSADGTRIATYVVGPPTTATIVLANGLGGNITAWRHLIRHFSDRMRIVTWDYRGLYRSSRPSHPSDGAYVMERHCDDLDAVLAAEGVEGAVFVGWSMGVQVNLEYYRRRPDRFAGLVLINGTYGRPFETAFRASWMQTIGPKFLDFLPYLAPLMSRSEPLVTRTRAFVALVKGLGVVSPTLDEDVFFDLAHDWLNLDFEAYSAIFRGLAEHDAYDVLRSIRVPTLVITGEKDLFTPVELSERMVSEVAGAEFLIIEGGTHYTPIEYPMTVNLRIQKFIEERVRFDKAPPITGAKGPGRAKVIRRHCSSRARSTNARSGPRRPRG